jgi:hypothetical protein
MIIAHAEDPAASAKTRNEILKLSQPFLFAGPGG